METKYQHLIQLLLKENRSITSKELAYRLNVSTKTIRNYVQTINGGRTVKLINSSHLGYTIDRSQLEEPVLDNHQISLPNTQDERVNYIVKSLLQSEENTIDLYEISEEIAISIESLKADLARVKEMLIDNNIYVNQRSEVIQIEGTEKDKRKLLSKLLSGEFSENLLNIDILKSIFPDYHLSNLVKYLNELFAEYHYFINDYALLNLILEICIEIDRIKRNFIQSERHNYLSDFSEEELRLVNLLADKLENDYQIVYTESEKKALANMVLSNITRMDFLKIGTEQLNNNLDASSSELIQILINQMKSWELFDVNDEKFLIKFSLHIKNLLFRIDSDTVIKNPLTNYLKQNCPLIFEHAIEIANTISNFTKKKISEDEITFLSLHIGSIMGESAYLNDRIKASLLLPNYYDFSYELMDKIESEFNQDLVINQVISSMDNMDYSSSELIINMGSFLYQSAVQEIQITPFYTKNDRSSIKKAIEHIKLSKKKSYLHKHLIKLTSNDLFFRVDKQTTKKKVIQFMCDRLLEAQAVESNYRQEVFERESQSSTAFGRVAVPHSINMNAKKNSLVVLISEKGIKWDKEMTVNIVLLFAVKKEERAIFFNVFDSIVTTLINPNVFQDIIKSKNLDDLIKIFLQHVDVEK